MQHDALAECIMAVICCMRMPKRDSDDLVYNFVIAA
jgi:hypothetical protein